MYEGIFYTKTIETHNFVVIVIFVCKVKQSVEDIHFFSTLYHQHHTQPPTVITHIKINLRGGSAAPL